MPEMLVCVVPKCIVIIFSVEIYSDYFRIVVLMIIIIIIICCVNVKFKIKDMKLSLYSLL